MGEEVRATEAGKRGLVIVPEEEKQADAAGFWPTSSPPRAAASAGAARMQPKGGSPLPWVLGGTPVQKTASRAWHRD